MKQFQFLCFFTLSLFLTLESAAQEVVTDAASPANPQDSTEIPYKALEDMPEYPGGNVALMNFLAQNLQYPIEAKEKNIYGNVIVRFVVEKDGSLSNIEILKSPNPDLSREAIRIVKILPPWKPGKLNGKPVRAQSTIPIRFKL